MEERDGLFSLSIDPVVKSHLLETARWARFLAIVSTIVLIAAIALSLYQVFALRQLETSMPAGFQGAGVVIVVTYIILFAIALFPIMYIFRFAVNVRTALHANNQEALTESFKNLKLYFRFLGILTIIALVFIILSLVALLIGFGAAQVR